MNNKEKAQVATEYLIITGFILIVVTIIFSYAYISNSQNIRISQTSAALDKMVNAADLVYALGPGNIQYVNATFPQGIKTIQDIAVCDDNSIPQGHNQDCGTEGVKFGAINLTMELFNGDTNITRGAKAELELDAGADTIPATAGVHRIKVEWCGNKICLKSA